MKRTWVAAAIISGMLAGSSFAADLRKPMAPPPPVMLVYSWSGFYAGGNFGIGWGDPRTDAAGSGLGPSLNFGPPVGFLPLPFAFTDSNTARLGGAILGGQIGYNYQLTGGWLVGFEADLQGSGLNGGNTFNDHISGRFCTAAAIPPACVGSIPFTASTATGYDAKIGWFGTVRGRAGFLVTDQILLYGTGGLAYGRVEVSGGSTPGPTATIGVASSAVAPSAGMFSAAKTNVGYTVGGGMEGKFSSWLPANWSWKAEYLYVDLGYLNSVAPIGGLILPAPGFPYAGAVALHTHFAENIVRAGINYQFGN